MSEERTSVPTPEKTLFPTFSCFTDAMELVDYAAREQPDVLPAWRIVHAICEGQNGQRYAHAWVEDLNLKCVLFAGMLMGEKVYMYARTEDFLQTYKVKESSRYTIHQAMINNRTSGHFGPWEQKYEELTGKGRRDIMGSGFMNTHLLGPLPKEEKNEPFRSGGDNAGGHHV